MNKKYVKVDASKNVNIERLEKYKTRFGYSVSCKNGVETFAVKLDNRLEYIFNIITSIAFLAKTMLLILSSIWFVVY